MSSPYGPPGGQQGPGSYGGPSGAPWGPGQGAPGYGPPQSGQGYGQGQQPAPGAGYPPVYGAPDQRGPGQAGPDAGPSAPDQRGAGQAGPDAGPSRSGSRSKPKAAIDFARILPLVVGVLGVLAFFFGFLSAWKLDQQGSDASISVYATAGAYLPILLLLTGLLAVAPLIPKGRKYTLPTALLAVVGFLAALTQLISGDGSYGANLSVGVGLILLLVVSLLQALAAAFAWLTESGLVKLPAPSGQTKSRAKKAATVEPVAPAQFGPTNQAGPQTGAQSGYGGSYPSGAYPPGGYAPTGGGPTADAPAYGGYRPNAYGPPNSTGETRNPYATPDSASPQSGTGATPTVDPGPLDDSPFRPGGRYSDAPVTGPSTGQHGRNDGPSPDETQQVRF